MKTIWDDLYDEEWLSGINAKLRAAQRLSDRQAFGMIRKEHTIEFKKVLTECRDELNKIIARVD